MHWRPFSTEGNIVIYVQKASPSVVTDTVGRCIKVKFMQFVFTPENKARPFAYIVDEAHRFVTAGEQDGEQSLLDRCRVQDE
jgi:hypothetical protein